MAARNPFASSVPHIYDPYASPYSRRAPLSTGYYFIKNLLIVGAVCGTFVAAYRNDVLLELSRRVGMESRYLAAEQYLVGTPGWGTPRSMGPVLNPTENAAPPAGEPAAAAPSAHSEPAVAAPIPAATAERTPAAEPAPAPVERTSVAAAPTANVAAPVAAKAALADPLAPVSLDSLPVLGKGAAPLRTVTESPAARAAAPAPVARSFVTASAPAATRPTPSPVPRSNGKALQVSLDDESSRAATTGSIPAPHRAAPHAAPEPAPAPVAAKPAAPPPGPKTTEAHKNDNPLMAAVRSAVRTRPPKDSVPAAP